MSLFNKVTGVFTHVPSVEDDPGEESEWDDEDESPASYPERFDPLYQGDFDP